MEWLKCGKHTQYTRIIWGLVYIKHYGLLLYITKKIMYTMYTVINNTIIHINMCVIFKKTSAKR